VLLVELRGRGAGVAPELAGEAFVLNEAFQLRKQLRSDTAALQLIHDRHPTKLISLGPLPIPSQDRGATYDPAISFSDDVPGGGLVVAFKVGKLTRQTRAKDGMAQVDQLLGRGGSNDDWITLHGLLAVKRLIEW